MELLLPVILFVFISTITPGPNNFLLATSGIKFGFRATIPHVIGVNFGVYILVALTGLGVGQLLASYPQALFGLKIFGTVYLCYLAWKILGFELGGDDSGDSGQPMRVLEALVFQFSNPKAWMMATTGINISLGFDGSMLSAVLILCAGFATFGLMSNLIWVSAGASLQKLWRRDNYRRVINGGLSLLTIMAVATFWLF